MNVPDPGPSALDERREQRGGSRASVNGNRPKLLFLCQTLPYPPDGGVSIRTYNIMRLLSRAYDIKALCFYRRATRPDATAVADSVRGLSRISDVQTFPIPQDGSRVRLIWDHLRSVVRRRVYTRFVYDSAAFSGALNSLLDAEDFDLVHMDSLDLSGYLPDLEGLPVICTHHNVESALLRRRAGNEPFPLGSYLKLQAGLMEAEERHWCGKVALNATVSKEDSRLLTEISPNATVTVVPNGVDTSEFTPAGDPEQQRGVVFVGGHSWYPNRDGMDFFARDILPLVRQGSPDLPVTWVGRSPERVRQAYEQEHGIALTGYVDDIRPHVDSAACYIVPLRVGGGTRLKILDAWAMGKAVVSTSIGCEGLEARDGENILVRDTPESFAQAVREVCADVGLRRRLGSGGRETAERIYEWEVIGTSMIEQYRAVARGAEASV